MKSHYPKYYQKMLALELGSFTRRHELFLNGHRSHQRHEYIPRSIHFAHHFSQLGGIFMPGRKGVVVDDPKPKSDAAQPSTTFTNTTIDNSEPLPKYIVPQALKF